MEQEKDYSLLRPFDLEAAKRGEAICDVRNNTLLFLAEAGDDGEHAIRATCGNVALVKSKVLRMAPLCWVEGRPVYKGDVLYRRAQGRVTADHISRDSDDVFLHYLEGGDSWIEGPDLLSSDLTWTPPKVKREGWVNIHPARTGSRLAAIASNVYSTSEAAAESRGDLCIACVRIEWEE